MNKFKEYSILFLILILFIAGCDKKDKTLTEKAADTYNKNEKITDTTGQASTAGVSGNSDDVIEVPRRGGKLVYRFNACKIIESIAEEEFSSTGFLGDNGEIVNIDKAPDNTKLVLIDISVENKEIPGEIDGKAELAINDITCGPEVYDLNKAGAEQIEMVYFDKHMSGAKLTNKNYFHYSLGDGEKLECQIGFFVPEKWIQNGEIFLYLAINDPSDLASVLLEL